MKRLLASLLLAPTSVALAVLPPVPVPDENLVTEKKRLLGKILFWDEQLSSDNTVACGTCHVPTRAAADPRIGRHPGADLQFFTADDVFGSPGVARADVNGDPVDDPGFGFDVQVTRRSAPTVINSGFPSGLLWDGGAGTTFRDPETDDVIIQSGGALENQALMPILNDVEMAREGRTWADVVAKLQSVAPLRLAADLPPDLSAVLSPDPSYGTLFASAFLDPEITPVRIAFALATYQRTLVADDTPWDRFGVGDADALTAEQQQGLAFFEGSSCSSCHSVPFFTSHGFANIGVRPVQEDRGLRETTGDPSHRGQFKIPSLRNIGLKPRFMHTGEFTSLDAVIEHYQPGNQEPENLSIRVPVFVPDFQRGPLIDFLQHGLTDERVATGAFPFDRPSLFRGLDPRLMLFFDDKVTMRWPEPLGAIAYRVYRGSLADLTDVDGDGLPDADYGECVTHLDPDDTDTVFADPQIPAVGSGLFYLKTIVDAAGPSGLGATSGGLVRLPAIACP